MATVHVVLAQASGRSSTGATQPVIDSVPVNADTLTSSASSAKIDFAAPASGWQGLFWSITASGGNVYARFGSDPTAVTDEGWLILDGQTREFAVSAASETVAIKDA